MKTRNLNRIVAKWRRKRERHKKLKQAPMPSPRPAETREGFPPTDEATS